MGTICDFFSAHGLHGCKLHDIESKVLGFAETGEGSFPAEIKSISYDHKDLTLRTGYFDSFKVEIEGIKGAQAINWSHDMTRALLERDLPDNVRKELQACVDSYKLDRKPDALRPAA